MFLLLLLPLLWGLRRVCIKREFIVIFNCILSWNAYIVLQHALDVPYEPLILWYYLLFPRTCFFFSFLQTYHYNATRHEKKDTETECFYYITIFRFSSCFITYSFVLFLDMLMLHTFCFTQEFRVSSCVGWRARGKKCKILTYLHSLGKRQAFPLDFMDIFITVSFIYHLHCFDKDFFGEFSYRYMEIAVI